MTAFCVCPDCETEADHVIVETRGAVGGERTYVVECANTECAVEFEVPDPFGP